MAKIKVQEIPDSFYAVIVRSLKVQLFIAKKHVEFSKTPGQTKRNEFDEKNYQYWKNEKSTVETVLKHLGEL